MPRITGRLLQAAARLSIERAEIKYRESLMEDIRSRANEMCRHLPYAGQPEKEMEPHQVDFILCLISRLGDYEIAQLHSVKEFIVAWDEACDKPKPKPQAVIIVMEGYGDTDIKRIIGPFKDSDEATIYGSKHLLDSNWFWLHMEAQS